MSITLDTCLSGSTLILLYKCYIFFEILRLPLNSFHDLGLLDIVGQFFNGEFKIPCFWEDIKKKFCSVKGDLNKILSLGLVSENTQRSTVSG